MASSLVTANASTGHPALTSMPSSAFLLARLETIRTAMLEHFQFILETAQLGGKVRQVSRDPANDRIYDENVVVDEDKVPTLAQTKMDQVRMNLEVEALIKNSEDLLSLSRVLKEGWVFGGLDTIKKPDPEADKAEAEEWNKARHGVQQWLQRHFEKLG